MTDDIETVRVPGGSGIPNNPDLPAVLARGAAPPDEASVRDAMSANGWGGLWTWTVYDYHHFHPASHEALVCVRGWAEVQLGGPEGPVLRVAPGDVLVLPAGFGHKRIEAGGDFAVVGAYPPGQESPEIVRAGDMDMDEALERIRATPLPDTDPVGGADGALMRAWR